MPILVAWLSLLTVICLLNLIFTFGVIRRLREHTQQLASRPAAAPDLMMLTAGEQIDGFTATTTTGLTVSRAGLTGLTLVGFFSPHCRACQERLPSFRTRAADLPGGRAQVIAVAIGSADETAELQTQLADVAQVVVEPEQSDMALAFGVRAYPAFALVDAGGTVVASGYDLGEIQVPVAS